MPHANRRAHVPGLHGPPGRVSLPLTRASGLVPLVAFLDSVGAPTAVLLERAGIPAALLEEGEALLPLSHVHRLIGLAVRWTGVDNLGAMIGQQTSAFDLGAFGQILARTVTVFDYLQTGSRLISAVTSGERFWMTHEGDLVRFHHFQPGFDEVGRCQSDLYVLAVTVRMLRSILGPDWSPSQVCVLAADERMIGNVTVFGDADVHLNQAHSSLTLTRSALERPIPHAMGVGPGSSKGMAALKPDMPQGFLDSIEALIGSLLGFGDLRVDVVAEAANTSTRTLQRRLRSHGVSYSDILEQTRIRVASEWLASSAMPIAEIAVVVGYSDPAHFSRAFRRRAGISPQQYRSRFR